MKTNGHLKKFETLSVTRRNFLKGASAVTAAAVFAGCGGSSDGGGSGVVESDPHAVDLREARRVYSTCPVECLHHSLNCQLVGDEVIRVEPTVLPDDYYYTTACGRGLSRMQFLSENRVATPMRRIKKGVETAPNGVTLKNNDIDEWESISWDTALREIGAKIRTLRAAGEPNMIAPEGKGNMGPITNAMIRTFFEFAAPNRVNMEGNVCCEAVDSGMNPVFGERYSDTRETVSYAKCIVCWGNNPAETSASLLHQFAAAKENGAAIITVDPRFSRTAEKSDMWVSLVPGTDVLLAIGMLREIFTTYSAQIDEDFLKHRTNAPFLIDLSGVKDDSGSPIDLFDPAVEYPWYKLYSLNYYKKDGEPAVFNAATGTIEPAGENQGLIDADGNVIRPSQDPDLHFEDLSGALTGGAKVATAYQIIRALYAGDRRALMGGASVSADLAALWDPTYSNAYITNTTGVPWSVIQDLTRLYATCNGTYEKKSMIFENMGGFGRTENGAYMAALHCMLTLFTGNIGAAGNGIDDTGGYGIISGVQKNDLPQIGTSLPVVAQVAESGVVHNIPFGVLGDRARTAVNGEPQTRHPGSTGNPLDSEIKLWWLCTFSLLTQCPNTDALKYALRASEMVVAAKPMWDTDAEFCDYYLPVATQFEYDDISPVNRCNYVQIMEAGVKPYGQARSDPQIFRDLAKIVFGATSTVAAQFDHSDKWFVEAFLDYPHNHFAMNGINGYEDLKRRKVIRPKAIRSPWVPYWNHEFRGDLNIKYRAKIFVPDWNYNLEYFPYPRYSTNPAGVLFRGPFPRYIPAMESQLPHLNEFYKGTVYESSWGLPFVDFSDNYESVRDNYPFYCVQMKSHRGIHSSFTAMSWIRETFGESGFVWIHPNDAHRSNVKDGETVTVTSRLGSVQRIARVTKFIKEGVTALENHMWDRYGPVSSSTVTADLPTSMKTGNTLNSTLVKIIKGGLSE